MTATAPSSPRTTIGGAISKSRLKRPGFRPPTTPKLRSSSLLRPAFTPRSKAVWATPPAWGWWKFTICTEQILPRSLRFLRAIRRPIALATSNRSVGRGKSLEGNAPSLPRFRQGDDGASPSTAASFQVLPVLVLVLNLTSKAPPGAPARDDPAGLTTSLPPVAGGLG